VRFARCWLYESVYQFDPKKIIAEKTIGVLHELNEPEGVTGRIPMADNADRRRSRLPGHTHLRTTTALLIRLVGSRAIGRRIAPGRACLCSFFATCRHDAQAHLEVVRRHGTRR